MIKIMNVNGKYVITTDQLADAGTMFAEFKTTSGDIYISTYSGKYTAVWYKDPNVTEKFIQVLSSTNGSVWDAFNEDGAGNVYVASTCTQMYTNVYTDVGIYYLNQENWAIQVVDAAGLWNKWFEDKTGNVYVGTRRTDSHSYNTNACVGRETYILNGASKGRKILSDEYIENYVEDCDGHGYVVGTKGIYYIYRSSSYPSTIDYPFKRILSIDEGYIEVFKDPAGHVYTYLSQSRDIFYLNAGLEPSNIVRLNGSLSILTSKRGHTYICDYHDIYYVNNGLVKQVSGDIGPTVDGKGKWELLFADSEDNLYLSTDQINDVYVLNSKGMRVTPELGIMKRATLIDQDENLDLIVSVAEGHYVNGNLVK